MTMKFDGNTYTMRDALFKSVNEHWNEYVLESGETVRVKLEAKKIQCAFDENDKQGVNSYGAPYVFVSYSVLVRPEFTKSDTSESSEMTGTIIDPRTK